MTRLLLVGPLPPPDTGHRIQCRLAFDYLRGLPHLACEHVELPIVRVADSSTIRWDLPRTLANLARTLLRLSRADAVIVMAGFDVCLSLGPAIAFCAKRLGKRCALRIMGTMGAFYWLRMPAAVRTVLLGAAERMDAVIVTETRSVARELPERLQPKTVVVPNCRFRLPAPPRQRRTGGGTAFAYIGRNTARKGARLLLDGFDRARAAGGERVELHVYGAIPAAETARAARTPGVVLHGPLPNDRLRAGLAQHDALLFPSLFAIEGIAGAIIEALLAGLPVVATRIRGPEEMIDDGVNGLLVESGDADGFAQAMTRLATDGALRRTLADGARRSSSRYDAERVLPALVRALGLPPAASGTAYRDG